MSQFALPVRWYPTVQTIPFDERDGVYSERTWEFPAAATALVLVDCWDVHPIQTHADNSAAIIREVIKPAIAACHRLGVTVVHAPSPGQARLYPQHVRYAAEADLGLPTGNSAAPASWPPAEFRQRTGEYQAYERPTYLVPVTDYISDRRILSVIEPEDNEFVIATGAQLHRLAEHRGILHLLFAGFAANMCVMERDYGIKAMHQRGYSCVLLRDATVAIEASFTYQERRLTEAARVQVEMLYGVSALAADLTAAAGW